VRPKFRKFSVFSLVGFGGFLIQISAIAALTRFAGWSAIAATVVALELAALHNFIGHSRWTWGDRRASSVRLWLRRYWRYQAAKTASLGANLAITTVLTYCGLPVEVANCAAVLACALPNYLVADQFVFSRPS
jgi:putative flippase GtrA